MPYTTVIWVNVAKLPVSRYCLFHSQWTLLHQERKKERKKERKGKERKGKERKGKERKERKSSLPPDFWLLPYSLTALFVLDHCQASLNHGLHLVSSAFSYSIQLSTSSPILQRSDGIECVQSSMASRVFSHP